MNEAEMQAGLARTSSYRYADRVGGRLFVAGQVPVDGDRQVVGIDDPAMQARKCLDNLVTLLETHGHAVADIHQLTVYVVGPHENLIAAWGAVTAFFDGDVPPATLLGVTVLGFRQQLVEIDAVVERVVRQFESVARAGDGPAR